MKMGRRRFLKSIALAGVIATMGISGCVSEPEPTPAPTAPARTPPLPATATPVPAAPAATPSHPGAQPTPTPAATPTPTLAPTPTSTPAPTLVNILQSEKQRVASPDVKEADLATLANGNSAFAFGLYQVLRENDGNLFYSPYSISMALAMTYAGARGDTENQMGDALQFLLPQDQLHAAFNSLDFELASRGEGAEGKDDEGFRLHIVNAIWGQKDFQFLSGYLDLLAENYGAGLRILDFMKAPEQSRITINDWVSEQTEDRINDLIPQGAIDELTRLVLTNAIYFNAAWQYPFDEETTSQGDFFLLNGDKVSVPMMRQEESFGYMKGDDYQTVELPYDGRELSMIILLPEQGKFASFEASLNRQLVDGIIQKICYQQVALSMPKFEYVSNFGLKQALAILGMKDAFIPEAANFSGMDGKKDLYIQDVLHKAFVSVDEAGTEAAAATAVIVGITAVIPSTPIEVTVDRPFIFLIRDVKTSTILFVGRVQNPSA
ncbi:MAG TPA: serpin family protein [Methanocellales archaeon]|nr:serpin family protein [Methanocellales archaeon]